MHSKSNPFQVQAPFECRQSIMPDAKTIRAYKASLLRLLTFLGGVQHPHGYEAMDERLVEIQDTEVVRLLNWEAFHNEAPGEDARSTYCHGSNLISHKRSISYLVPKQLMTWDPKNNMGNPTRLLNVLKAISDVTKIDTNNF
jgi:hypothetical protein